MADKDVRYASVEETLFQLMQSEGAKNMGEGKLLVLLSLVNLMGIIDIINQRAGIKKVDSKNPGADVQHEGGKPIDPAHEFAMLGDKESKGINPGQLVEMLSSFIATPQVQQRGAVSPNSEIREGAAEISKEESIRYKK